jgi:hypothetical protein
MSPPANLTRQKFGLVEPALPSLAPMQGHGHDDIETLFPRQGARQQPSQRRRQRLNAAVLEKVNQLAQFVFVESERVRRVEPSDTSAAQCAPSLIVERKAAQEWRAALRTTVFRRQGFRLGQAGATNRDTRKIL